MEAIELQASPRTVLGKKVRHLRRRGMLPANLFGHNVASQALQVEERAFQRAFAQAGMNTLISLKMEGAEPKMVLIRGLQRNPLRRDLLHVDFYQVAMMEKLTAQVPLVFVGEAPGVAAGGILLHNIDEVEIECLPGDLLRQIDVDISGLQEIDDAIHVKDLKVSAAIKILRDPDEVVVKILPPAKEEVEEAVAEVVPAEVEEIPKGKEAKEKEAEEE
ncbi:MAG: 50S ribosomal protein L25 [Chloroflexi bacterium]|nr:50S ribosomal protein L25 [Chloroflexota bacterium]